MRRHRVAQANLEKAYESRKPAALMVGPDNFELGRVIGLFLAGLDERTTCVRLRQPQDNALAALGEITRAIGFDPKDLTVSDLQHVIAMFLEYQGNHGHRTVLSVERADQQSMWLLDCVARLIRSSTTSAVGRNLFVIISGTGQVVETLQNAAFEVIRREAGEPIRLAPFSVFETREFVRQISETAGLGDIQSIFEFDALERLHRISGGVPFVVARLFRESVGIIRKTDRPTATAKVVVKAARNLRAASEIDTDVGTPPLVHVREAERNARRLLIRCPKLPDQEFALRAGRFMIGRASTADIRLSSASVSRRHALLIDTGKDAQVLDLGGMNGTFDGSERIAEAVLSPGTVLTLGDCQIEYAVD
jgi:hypothetical protein